MNKINNTWLLGDMEFLISSPTRCVNRSLHSLVNYQVKTLEGKIVEISYLRAALYYVPYMKSYYVQLIKLCTTSSF